MENFTDIIIYLFIPGVISMFLLTTFIQWASFISEINLPTKLFGVERVSSSGISITKISHSITFVI